MSKPKTMYSEIAYVLGIVLIALGVAFMEKADFGVSMIVAPAYLLYRWVSTFLSWFTFGMAEYTLQAVLLILLCISLRRFKVRYLFSFVTAVLYGFVLDGLMFLVAFIPGEAIWIRVLMYIFGMLFSAAGVAFMFHTYVAPEVYELVVKEITSTFGLSITKVKTIYDCTSCLVGVIMSFLIFGFLHFEGVKAGTIICALINGLVIGFFSGLYEKKFTFKDRFTAAIMKE